eukprot:GGOE01004156.1.p1 GENE.GGOE01004156.1~~GGOE01004156.1.p1  ORF type:complete len:374 (-),score=78.07 GGOE01004156.1:444-1565(-)
MPSRVTAPLPPPVPVASVVPDNVNAAECVTGTVVVEQHAKDIEAVHSLFRHGPSIVLFGRPYARVLSHIANGTWSSVYFILQEETKRFAALKVIPLGAANTESYYAEVEILRRFRHRHIVQLHGHFVHHFNDVKCLCIELEHCEKGTLKDYIHRKQWRLGQLSTDKITTFISQLISALRYIHAQGLLHGDVRPATILVTQENELKLASFGSPLWIERQGRVSRTITGGDRVYAPPEWADSVVPHRLLQQMETPLPSYDMWSLGCVVSELVTLKLLRQDRHCTSAMASDAELLRSTLGEVATSHAGLFAPLCSGLLSLDPNERLTAGEARHMLHGLTPQGRPTEGGTSPSRARRWLSSLRAITHLEAHAEANRA